MDDGLKQRVIGAVVLVALGVIFIPMLFDESPTLPSDIEVDIPPKPAKPEVSFTRPEPPASAIPQATKEKVVEEVIQPDQILDKAGLPVAWSIQVGTFSERERARALRNTLFEAGFKAYVKSDPDNQSALLKVLVGPESDRDTLEALKATLAQQMGLNGFAVRYSP